MVETWKVLGLAVLAGASLWGAPAATKNEAHPDGELDADWIAQDGGAVPSGSARAAWRAEKLARRAARLKPVVDLATRWVYCRHYVMGGSHYAYTEALSDAAAERTFIPMGSSLCLAEYNPDGLWRETELLSSKEGCFRDVDVSPDGKRLLYSFKASDRGDDFHLYEMDLATRVVKQLTFGAGAADYEGCYLPDGHILFNSTRCQQIVDCWWTEVSNLYRCDADGGNITRLTYDQVHDNYPSLTWDGRILYTRWEYNDRSQMFPQPLFGMNPDGTNQRAVYGGNSWFPTTLIHARAVRGSALFFGIATGHHSLQPGELMRFDPRLGREEAAGAWQLAPLRPAQAVRVDAYGQAGRVAAYPYPVNEDGVVLAFLPEGWPKDANGHPHYREHRAPFGLYWTDVNGARELLVARAGKVPCGRPVPVCARTLPNRPSVRPDETRTTGVFAVRDVYVGESMKGVPRGTVKSLRVVSIDYRPAGIGQNGNGGPGGGGLSCTPPSLGNGTWGVKRVLGEVPVAEDGSVAFEAPARTPLYFILLDGKGRMVQSMRSWATLQPGETASCIGCHESPNLAPDFKQKDVQAGRALASLKPAPRGFSFAKDVQPILDRRCVGCHNPQKNPQIPDLTSTPVADAQSQRTWTRAYVSLTRARPVGQDANLHYTADPDNPLVNWIHSASVPTPLAPRTNGSGVSRLFTDRLDKGHAPGLTDAEARTLACWIDLGVPFCGDYAEGARWDEAGWKRWAAALEKRTRLATKGEPAR